MAAQGPYILEYDATHMRALIRRVGLDDAAMSSLGQVVRKVGLIIQTRAVYNVSGNPVSWEGGAFVVRVRTGALRGSIEMEYPYTSPLMVRVYVNGSMTAMPEKFGGFYAKAVPVKQYAWAIERGHDPIDLKKTMLGKVVPFFAARSASATGPYSATGLKPVLPGNEGPGSGWQSSTLNAKLQARGKGPMTFTKKGGAIKHYGGNASYFIAFRRVGKTGWVIPVAKPRPFMRQAGANTREQARLMFRRGILAVMRGETP